VEVKKFSEALVEDSLGQAKSNRYEKGLLEAKEFNLWVALPLVRL